MARLFGVLATIVSIGWLIGFLAPIWVETYKPAPELNMAMMAVVGIFVALYNKAKKPSDPGDGTRGGGSDD